MEFETAKKIAESSGSNFLTSFFFLPKEKAQALQVIYAYCRVTDDIVDAATDLNGTGGGSAPPLQKPSYNVGETHCGPPKQASDAARAKLDEWRKETLNALRGKSENPLLKELQNVAEKYNVPEAYLLELIDGVEMDLTKTSYKNFEELYPYCYKVASVVGLICLQIFSYKNNRSKDYAISLGVAFQLTNILRDILTDAQRGRVYIPEEDLAKFSLTKENFLELCESPPASSVTLTPHQLRGKNLILYECQRAEHFYKKAKENLPSQDRSNLVAAEVMCSVYKTILKKIKKNPLSVFKGKIQLPKRELYFRALSAWLLNRLKI